MKALYLSLVLLLWPAALVAQEAESTSPDPADIPAEETVDAVTLDGLLEAVRSGRLAESRRNEERVAEFRRERNRRDQMLKDIIAEERRQERISQEREAQFEDNESRIGELEDRLKERMGSLKELFGVLQQVASDAQAQFHGSLTQLEFSDRTDFLVDFAGRMGQANRLPALSEIEKLWFELQREMIESGRVVTAELPVVTSDGTEQVQPVTHRGYVLVRCRDVHLNAGDGKWGHLAPSRPWPVRSLRRSGFKPRLLGR